MSVSDIENILGRAMGLKISSIGNSTLQRALNRRLRALEMDNQESYVQILKTSPLELKELIEEVVIPETWFFRNKEPFFALTEFVHQKWSQVSNKQVLRILSAPCSTGEEPYSITMTLLHSGWPEKRFHVDALDISSRALSLAKEAVYGDNSFREKEFNYCYNYFQKTETDKYKLRNNVQRKVSFFQGNLLNPAFTSRLGIYDIIFCRNLLIYLDPPSQKKTIDTLSRLLDPAGLLFLGHAEAGLFGYNNFIHSPYRKAFAFYKKTAPEKLLQSDAHPPPTEPAIKKFFPEKVPPSTDPGKQAIPPLDRDSAPSKSIDLTEAQKLADQGRMEESRKICDEYLRHHKPSSKCFFLLGIINDVSGQTEDAIRSLKKAIYLDPDHWEALLLLALILERSGDKEGANYRRRAERVRVRKEGTAHK